MYKKKKEMYNNLINGKFSSRISLKTNKLWQTYTGFSGNVNYEFDLQNSKHKFFFFNNVNIHSKISFFLKKKKIAKK